MRRGPAFVLLFGITLGCGLPHIAAAQEPEAVAQTPVDEPKPISRPAPQTRSEALAAGLQRQLDAAAQVQLGTDDTFLALWQPANVGQPRGVLVIVPSEGETADWPRVVGPIRHSLAEHGWHTLSLTPVDPALSPGPRPPAQETPAATATPDSEAQAGSTDEQPPAEPDSAGYLPEQTASAGSESTEPPSQAQQQAAQPTHAERMQGRLDAAIEHARGLQAPAIVLLGHGTGAYWASRYLAQLKPKDVGQLILIDPRPPLQSDSPLESYLAALPVGIGDFYTNSRPGEQQQALQRRNAAQRGGHPDYRQVALPPLATGRYGEQEQLVRRIRGWLDRKPTR